MLNFKYMNGSAPLAMALTKRVTGSGAFGCYKYKFSLTQFSQTQTLSSHKHK
jgi:hypothetical protein